MRLLLAISMIFASIATSSTAVAQEQPWKDGFWAIWKTDEGCLYYKGWSGTLSQSDQKAREWSKSWQGPVCAPGKLINGTGTVVETRKPSSTKGREPDVNRTTCSMVNGLCNGTVTSNWANADGTNPGSVSGEARMGCFAGPAFADCRSPTPPVGMVDASGTAAPSVAQDTPNLPKQTTNAQEEPARPGEPVTAGGAKCVSDPSEKHWFPEGTSGKFERYDYEFTNRCAPMVVTVYWGANEEHHTVVYVDKLATWSCTVGFIGNSDCPGGLKSYSVRLAK